MILHSKRSRSWTRGEEWRRSRSNRRWIANDRTRWRTDMRVITIENKTPSTFLDFSTLLKNGGETRHKLISGDIV